MDTGVTFGGRYTARERMPDTGGRVLWTAADATIAAKGTGIDTTKRQDGFAGWACYWGDDPAFVYAPSVGIEVRRYVNLTGTPTKIGGRRAQVVPSTEQGDTTCTVSLVQRTFTQTDGSSRVEVLSIRA